MTFIISGEMMNGYIIFQQPNTTQNTYKIWYINGVSKMAPGGTVKDCFLISHLEFKLKSYQ